MAVRGVLTTISFYPEGRDAGDLPLYAYQNHFPTTKTIFGQAYEYNSFQAGQIASERGAALRDVPVTFAATADNVDLLSAALKFRQEAEIIMVRWSAAEGIDNPSSYALMAAFAGVVRTGSSDTSTFTVNVNGYSDTLLADLPWRKIPWTILGPLSFRR